VKIPKASSAFAQPFTPRGRVRFVTAQEAMSLFPPVWEELRRQRPGVPARSEAWWELRTLRLPPEQAATPKRFAVVEMDGVPAAYAVFRIHFESEDGAFTGRTEVVEAIGATPQGTAEVWRFLLDVDWSATITANLLPPDHPLFLLLANPRRMVYRMSDSLWVRLVDVGAVLSGRAYAGEGSIVLEVRDATCAWNEGRWKLERGAAARTEEPAEIALDVAALGSVFLGAVSFRELAEGLRIKELVPGALARADAIFGWRPLPWCPEIF
jgi:predicted acetyltransferase